MNGVPYVHELVKRIEKNLFDPRLHGVPVTILHKPLLLARWKQRYQQKRPMRRPIPIRISLKVA